MTRSGSTLLLALVVLAAGFAGCTAAFGPSAATDGPPEPFGPCDVDEGATASGNAPRLEAFRGEPDELAARLADAVGDPLAGDAERKNNWTLEWATESGGYLTHDTGDGDAATLHWVGYVDEAESGDDAWEALLDRVFAAFGIAEDDLAATSLSDNEFNVLYRQLFRDEPGDVGTVQLQAMESGSNPGKTYVTLDLATFHDVSDAEVRHNREAALATAKAHVRCLLDAEGMTEDDGYTYKTPPQGEMAFWDVAYDSLVRRFSLRYDSPEGGHCGGPMYSVVVDAETGALLGSRPLGCY